MHGIFKGVLVDKGNLIIKLVKGFIIGASMLVPGASGGTMAIILGIYDDLIHAVSTLRQHFKENAILLGTYGCAGVIGILLFSRPMLAAITMWPKPTMFFFLGAILGSIPPLYRKVRTDRLKPINVVVAGLGALLGVSTRFLPAGVITLSDSFQMVSVLMLLFAGLIIAVALVLPGISASYILLMLGMYDITLVAIQDLNLLFLLPLAIGVVGGTLLTTEILGNAMEKHPQFTYMLIIGFMIGSLLEVFPGVPQGLDILYCLITFVAGLFIILRIGRNRTY